MPRNPFARRINLLRKLHTNAVLIYLNPDGRATVVHRKSAWRKDDGLTKRSKRIGMKLVHEFRWTVYAKNGRIVQASTEGYRNKKMAIANASLPPALPAIPNIGNGYLVEV